jgi:hypothetical protein
MRTADELDAQLAEWKEALPISLRPGSTIVSSDIPLDMHVYTVLYLHYAYFGSLIAIHSTFTYPWTGMFGRRRTPALIAQVRKSTEIVAESSRYIILATKYITDIYAWTPVWLVFYFPVLGLINLFVHVLKNPLLPTVQSDIALMDMAAGHFARLEFASFGQLSFSFAREISSLARLAVRKATKSTSAETADTTDATSTPTRHLLQYEPQADPMNDIIPYPQASRQDADSFEYAQMDVFEMSDFDMENWSALLPSFSPGELMNLNEMTNDCDAYLGS